MKLQGEVRVDESDKERLCLLEDQLKQLLEALISVADMVSGTGQERRKLSCKSE